MKFLSQLLTLFFLFVISLSTSSYKPIQKSELIKKAPLCGPYVIVRNMSSTTTINELRITQSGGSSSSYYNIGPNEELEIGSMSMGNYNAMVYLSAQNSGSIRIHQNGTTLACEDYGGYTGQYPMPYYGDCFSNLYIDIRDFGC